MDKALAFFQFITFLCTLFATVDTVLQPERRQLLALLAAVMMFGVVFATRVGLYGWAHVATP